MSILYKVASPAGKINYICGSTHSTYSGLQQYSDEFKAALQQAKTFYVENQNVYNFGDLDDSPNLGGSGADDVIEQEMQKQAMRRKLLEDAAKDPKLKRFVTTDDNGTVNINPHTLYNESDKNQLFQVLRDLKFFGEHRTKQDLNHALVAKKPLELANMFEHCYLKTMNTSDTTFTDDGILSYLAYKENKTLKSLSLLKEQLEALVLPQMNLLEQKQMLMHVTTNIKKLQELNLDQAVMAGNIDVIQQFNQALMLDTDTPGALAYRKYMRGFLDIRNQNWAQKLQSDFNQGDTFAVVGVRHLPGLLQNLKHQGFVCERVAEGKSTNEIAVDLDAKQAYFSPMNPNNTPTYKIQ